MTRNPSRTCAPVALAAICLAAVALAQPQPRLTQPQLVLLDGQAVAIQLLSIAAGKLSGEGVPDGLSLDDLRRIDLPVPPGAAAGEKPAVVVELRAGGRLNAK